MISRDNDSTPGDEKAMMSKLKGFQKKGRCYRCGKYEHYKQDCKMTVGAQFDGSKDSRDKSENHKAKITTEELSEGEALITVHALTVGGVSAAWVVDSGATSHMCYHRDSFIDYEDLQRPEKVTLGDGRNLEAVGRGTVSLVLKSLGSEAKPWKLYDTLHVPDLSFNLVSVSKVTEAGLVVKFLGKECQFINSQKQVIVRASACISWIVGLESRGMQLRWQSTFGIRGMDT